MKPNLIFFIVIAFISCSLSAQVSDTPQENIEVNEAQSNFYNDNIASNELEGKKFMYSINELDRQKLSNFYWLNARDIELILSYIAKHRPVLSPLELQTIDAIPLEKIRLLLPYLKLDQSPRVKPIKRLFSSESNNILVFRIGAIVEKQQGFIARDSIPAKYIGSKDKVYLAYRSQIPGVYSIGINMEKDAGEEYFSKTSPVGVDYLSSHLAFFNLSKNIKSIIVGDYSARLGQGLLLDNSYVAGKGSQFGSFYKNGSVVKPFVSVQENNMLRGIAAQLQYKRNWEHTVFISQHKIDANIVTDTISNNALEPNVNTEFSSSLYSGFHRTASEIEDRNKIQVAMIGQGLRYRRPTWDISLNGFLQKTNINLKDRPDRPDLKDVSTSAQQDFISLDYRWVKRNLSMFGEAAMQNRNQFAVLQGLLVGLGKRAEYISMYRHYGSGYSSMLSAAFSESTLPRNEIGLLQGFSMQINQRFSCLFFADHWKKPWLSYNINLPVSGSEYSFRLQYSERRKFLTYLQLVSRQTENNIEINSERLVKEVKKYSIRLHFESKISPDWTWRTRFETNLVKNILEKKSGALIYSDLLYKSIESKISGNIRFALFDTEDYLNRIYAYENDLLYQFSIPAYYGLGSRVVGNLRYRVHKKITTELHLSRTFQKENESIGSGNEKINSPFKTEVKFQIRYSF